jgi:soluble lytic murein transglycosylase
MCSQANSVPKDEERMKLEATAANETRVRSPRPSAQRTKGAPANERTKAPKATRIVPMPRPRPRNSLAAAGVSSIGPTSSTRVSAEDRDPIGRLLASTVPMSTSRFLPASRPPSVGTPTAPVRSTAPTKAEVRELKSTINLARQGQSEALTDRLTRIHNEAARTLAEWVLLRSDGSNANFARYAAFLNANQAWPSRAMFRRRAEARLWSEKHAPGAVVAFFSDQEPLGALGKLAMGQALLARGDLAAARRYVRAAWREDGLSARLEAQVLKMFGSMLDAADHTARMHVQLYAGHFDTAMRAAKRLGGAQVAIVKARVAVSRGSKDAHALLRAVPKEARNDPAYLLTRVQWLRRHGRTDEAARLILSARHDARVVQGADAWWIERRTMVREMLDDGKPQIAYRISRDAALPSKESLRVDQPFTAGWIALRFLHDPQAAARHFARIRQVTTHPTSLARAHYWLGRADEAAGRGSKARRHYRAAAQHSTAYYGQLARARLGLRVALRSPPILLKAQREALRNVDLVQAVQLLYETGNRSLVVPFVADLDRVGDANVLTLIAEIAARHKDARAMLYVGRGALARGLAFDQYAFPGVGLPKYTHIGPKADRSLVYAVARAESAFNPAAVSGATAKGLMQVMPATGRTIARRLGLQFDLKRLADDPVYNVQMGSAEIADLIDTYDGNHILAFAGYNAGRGRVKQWIARYGDPREEHVDVVDWVERIPFTETRTYVQRVIENLQVYRSRFADQKRFTMEADMRGVRD